MTCSTSCCPHDTLKDPWNVRMCVYTYVCVCVSVCMYFLFVCLFIKHAPLQWSNTTCCNYTCYWFSFVCRGCSDQPQSLHSLYNLKQYTNRINPVHLEWHLFSLCIYIYPIITDQVYWFCKR